ncbi:YCF48-related protein [Calycomorphotria hydatis]|uniref:Ycf48-like protein n=1 Tax=Calycomorphotria hydatis TaxID=2528027 RepID=A0A517TEZ3_9PLAN|nr:YCF48-related protein [Calycomorphotria hydatis]QDT66944.1 Ycf48-like protein [Calycomorphotria hydatis]
MTFRIAALCGTLLFLLQSSALCEEHTRDDFTLRDVQLLGEKLGWAVGDGGTVWQRTDGEHWTRLNTPTEMPLHAVCFLTDKIGWIVGGEALPIHGERTPTSQACVLFTEDGGKSWRFTKPDGVPRMRAVRFFGLEDGIALCDSSPQVPTGLIRTHDGGKSWQPVEGDRAPWFESAAFVDLDTVLLAGQQSRFSIFREGRLLPTRIADFGLRGFHDVTLQGGDVGWAVGDGGLILKNDTTGLSWTMPPASLPSSVRAEFDLFAVAARGEHVWVAGKPGSVIWHSADAGQTWESQPTGQTVPLLAMEFVNEKVGVAVGALGAILQTTDGGATWLSLHAESRRAALMAVTARPAAQRGLLHSKVDGVDGYRSIAHVPVRHDVGDDTQREEALSLAVHDAVAIAGGSAVDADWRFPVDIPGIERSTERLVEVWNNRTDGKFEATLLGSLVRRLRMWRPSVVVLDQPMAGEELTRLINLAVTTAITQAADGTRFPQHAEDAFLTPWKVERVFYRLPDGSVGDVVIDPARLDPQFAFEGVDRSLRADERLTTGVDVATPLVYRFHDHSSLQSNVSPRDFFMRLNISPGGDARRLPLTESLNAIEQQARTQQLQQWRHWRGMLDQQLRDGENIAEFIAHVGPTTQQLPEGWRERELQRIFQSMRDQSDWSALETLTEGLLQDPQPSELRAQAAQWLMAYWAGSEPHWYRQGDDHITAQHLTAQPDGSASGRTRKSPRLLQRRDERALSLGLRLFKEQPELLRRVEITRPLITVINRRRGNPLADALIRNLSRPEATDAEATAALTELLQPELAVGAKSEHYTCRRTLERPKLDGKLAEPCWSEAEEIRLKAVGPSSPTLRDEPFVLMAHDEEFLYLTASVPRHSAFPPEELQLASREHDESLVDQDRIELTLDLDRDHETCYRLVVDHRGHTAEDCWGDIRWNPKWYVAAEGDAGRWRVEVAIPFDQLGPTSPQSGAQWAMTLRRIIPAYGVQQWGEGQSFGRLAFTSAVAKR